MSLNDGLTWEESMRSWGVIGSSIMLHSGYLMVPNILYDAVAAIIPQNDMSVFMYLYRRIVGYPSKDEIPTAVVPFEHFTNGRRNKYGCPGDFGCGLAVAATQASLARLKAAKMVKMEKRGKGGRLGSPDGPQGSTWSIGPGEDWTFAPFYEVMTYGQLGRYTLAAKWGKLPPPRTAKEAKLLQKHIDNRRVGAPKAPEIILPDEWFDIDENVHVLSQRDNSLLSHRDNSVISRPDNSVISQRDNEGPDLGLLEEEIPSPKYTSRKTPKKDTSIIDASPTREDVKVGGKTVKPSKDGLPPKEWERLFIEHCYSSPPGAWWKEQVRTLHALRAEHPLDIVLAFYDYKRGERGMAERVITPRMLYPAIDGWGGLKQAQRDYERGLLRHAATPGEREHERHTGADTTATATPGIRRPAPTGDGGGTRADAGVPAEPGQHVNGAAGPAAPTGDAVDRGSAAGHAAPHREDSGEVEAVRPNKYADLFAAANGDVQAMQRLRVAAAVGD